MKESNMQITNVVGDLFENLNPGDVLAHGCNVMGETGGFAGAVMRAWPEVERNYHADVELGLMTPGSVQVCFLPKEGIYVANLATQVYPGADARIELIFNSMHRLVRHIERSFDTLPVVKIPRIGSGIGGLDWNHVESELSIIDTPVEVEAYYLL